MARRSSFSLNFAAVWFGHLVALGNGAPEGLPGHCDPNILNPETIPRPKVDESWKTMLKCVANLVVSGRELEKSMKVAAWRNNRYRQAFEPTVAFWGYLAGVPWPEDNSSKNTDTNLDNLIKNSEFDGMKGLDYSTGKVKALFDELSYYTGIKPKKKRAWFHPPAPPVTDEPPAPLEKGRIESALNALNEPVGRNFSDFFWHPWPSHRDRDGKTIVHGEQIEKMQPDKRLDAHGFNPNLVWTEHHVPLTALGKRES